MGPKPGAKRGRKPSQKIVQNMQQQQVEKEEDEAEFQIKLELIELIQGYPCIYDVACLDHKKEGLRNAAWQEIADVLFLPGTIGYILIVFHIYQLLQLNK